MSIQSNHAHPVDGPVCVLHSPTKVIYYGVMDDPIHAFGPFDSEAEALLWEEQHDDDCHRLVIPLIDPVKVDRS